MKIVDDILLRLLATGKRAIFPRLLANIVDMGQRPSGAPFETS